MESLLTAGGIHTALQHGSEAGHAIADFMAGRSADPATRFVRHCPSPCAKRLPRWALGHRQTDAAFKLLRATRTMR